MRRVFILTFVLLAACTSSAPAALTEPIGEFDPNFISDTAPVISPECEPYVSAASRAGLQVPLGYQVICPGGASGLNGRSHWGITCFGGRCPEGQGPYISINLNRIGPSEERRKYVVLHELCHANGARGEQVADACAAQHGASLRDSPYS